MLKSLVKCLIRAAILVSLCGTGQQLPPRTYRFVSEWRIPRAKNAAFAAELENNVRPLLEKMVNDGTVFDFGIYATVIHENEGVTHGYWYDIPTLVAMERVQSEMSKIPQSAIEGMAISQHDYLLRILSRHAKSTRGSNGYYYLNSTLIQPGKRDEWRAWWDKYQKPMYEQFLADGLITAYEIESGEIHTMDPNWVYLTYVAPSADAIDKLNNAFRIRVEKRAPEENRAINSALEAIVVPGSHRDYLARASSYGMK